MTTTQKHLAKLGMILALLSIAQNLLIRAQAPEPKPGSGNIGSVTAERQATLVLQLGHTLGIYSISFSSDGKYVLTGSGDRTARLWEAETGRELRSFVGHSGGVNATFSPDGKYVLTGSSDKTARLWETETGKELRRFEGHSDAIDSVAFSPAGKYVATGSSDKTARLWEAETGREVRKFEGHSDKVSSVVFAASGKYVLTGSWDRTARIWETETGREIQRFAGHSSAVFSVAFSPDGDHVLTGGDTTARLWEAGTGQAVQIFKGHSEPVDSVLFSPDGEYVLTGSWDKTARLWETTTAREVQRFEGVPTAIYSLAISPDGKHVVAGSSGFYRSAHLWDRHTGRELRRFEGVSTWVNSVAVSADGKYVLIGSSDNTARLWDLDTGKEARRFKGHSNSVIEADFSLDGKYVVTASSDKTARLWETETGNELRRFEGHSDRVDTVAFSHDGKSVLTGSHDKTARLWDAATGKEVKRFEHWIGVGSVAFSPDRKHIFSTDNAGHLWEIDTGKEVRKFEAPEAHFFSAAFSPDGNYVLTGNGDQVARLWDTKTGREVRRFSGHVHTVISVAFSLDGKHVVTGSVDGTARLWEPETGRVLQRYEGHSSVDGVALARNGRSLLTVGRDFTTRVWDLYSGTELCRFISFTDGTWAVVDPAGRFDTNNLEEIKGLHWVMPDDPMKPLPLEIFMRDYYEPRLLARILNGEKFKDVRSISEVNRVQPGVEISSIAQQKDNPELVTVTVEVGKATGEFKQGQRKITRETGVYDVRLFRDGQIVGQWPEPEVVRREVANAGSASDAAALDQWRQSSQVKLDQTGKQIIKFENIRLPRQADLKEIEFSAYAFNEDRVKSQTDRERFEVPKGLVPAKGRAYVISVGVNTFENQDWNLLYAANDARLTQKILFDKLTQTGQYEAVIKVSLISDAEKKENRATKANFKAVLDLLSGRKISPEQIKAIPDASKIREARPEDLVVMSFSSHGYADRGGSFYLFPADSGKGRMSDQNKEKLISSEELSLWLRDVDAGEMVMIVDACHAAAAVEGEEFKPGPMGSRGLGQLSYDKGMRILTATQAANVAIEAGLLGHGLLTYALVREGLEKHAADFKPTDRAINLKEWLEYGTERVPALYEEMRTGKVKHTGRATLAGAIKGKRVYQQQPSLFDFSRKGRDAVLVKLPGG